MKLTLNEKAVNFKPNNHAEKEPPSNYHLILGEK